eukprot:5614949-Karenia_brevis.AAC.1
MKTAFCGMSLSEHATALSCLRAYCCFIDLSGWPGYHMMIADHMQFESGKKNWGVLGEDPRRLKHVDDLRRCKGMHHFSDSELEIVRALASSGGQRVASGTAVKRNLQGGNDSGIESNFVCRAFVRGGGPMSALKRSRLGDLDDEERFVWCEQARLDAIIGSQRLSIKMLQS